MVNFGEVRRAQLAKSIFLSSMSVTLGSFKVCSDAKERVRCGKQGKTGTLVPEFVVEDLPLGRSADLVAEFAVRDLPLGRTF